MSKLREAAQAALNQWDKVSGVFRMTAETEALRVALAQPEAEPVAIGPEWTPCVKLPITVHVREQRDGEQHVSTREGITPVKPDDLIMRGVAGEEYPIGRELFNRTYRIGAHPPRDEWRPASEPPTESTIATEIKAARDELATWSKERQDAARVSAVAMTPPTTEECSGFCHPDEPRCVITEDGKCDAGNPQRGAR